MVARKPVQVKKPTKVKTKSGMSCVFHPSVMMELKKLKRAGYNPRKIDGPQLEAICRSIVKFGFVEPLVVRKDDLMIIGGHQRVAALEYLLAGKYKVQGEVVEFHLTDGNVPVVLVSDITESDSKLLNLALNKVGGEWDFDLLPKLLDELVTTYNLEEVTVTGFGAAEITDYLDVLSLQPPSGTQPGKLSSSPKVTLDFSRKEYRDAFKAFLSEMTAKADTKRPTGDVVAQKLGVIPA